MPAYPLPTLAPIVDSSGITIPTYEDVYQSLIASFQLIYGSDIYVSADSQDGQWIAILARAIYDTNQAAVSVFRSYSPTYAQGTALSSNIKLNGLTRNAPTNSTALGVVTGTVGITILNGVVKDEAGNLWDLPASVVIGISGQTTVTVTAQVAGNITATVGTITQIFNPQLGWQSFTNTAAAIPGTPVESDAALRVRQTIAVAQPSQSILGGLLGDVAALPGVTRFAAYENPTNAVDANGLPPHSISVVTEGGTSSDIATVIANEKTIGTTTNGTTTVTVLSDYGIPIDISYYPVTAVEILVALSIHPINGYTSVIGDEIKAAVVAYINALAIGQAVLFTRLYSPANLYGAANGLTYEITSLAIAASPGVPAPADVAIGITEAAFCQTSGVTITLV